MSIHPSAYKYVITFGPFAGQTYGYLAEQHPAYLEKISGSIGAPEKTMIAAAKTLMGEPLTDALELATLEKIHKVQKSVLSNAIKPELYYIEKGDRIAVRIPNNPDLVDRFKAAIDGNAWDMEEHAYTFPAKQILKAAEMLGGPKNIQVSDLVKKRWKIEYIRKKELDTLRNKDTTDIVVPTKLELFGYQKVFVEFWLRAGGRCINGDQMGLGKGPMSIGAAELKQAKTLIICPKNLTRTVWEREVKKFADKPVCIWDTVNGPIGNINSQYHVIHYDIVKKYLKELLKIKFDLLICDEATYLQNKKAIRTKAVLGSYIERGEYPGIKTKWVIFLTGTPLLTRPRNLFPLLHSIDAKRFNGERHFLLRYEGDPFNPHPQNLKELHERIQDVMIRRLTKDIRGEVAQKQIFDLTIEMDESQEKRYQSFELKLFKKWNIKGSPSAAAMPEVRNFLFDYKFPRLVEWIDEMLESERKVVVWTIQVEHGERIAAHYGSRARLINGSIPQKKRDKSIEDLRNGKADIAVMTIGTSAFGVDGLQYHFDAEIFVDEWYVPGINEQAEDRLNRIGQTNPIHIWYMQVKNTFNEDVREVVAERRRAVDLAVDGVEAERIRTQSVFGEAMRRRAMKRGIELSGTDKAEIEPFS